MPLRRAALSLVCFALGCAGGPTPQPAVPDPPAPPVAAERPALVVLVVVDQLADGQIARVSSRLNAGLARLTGPDAWSGVAIHDHASTETCPGHATIATGASPSVHGIVGNGFMLYGKRSYCLDAEPLPVQSIGDVVSASGGSVVALSIKDRGATLLAGKTPTQAVWMNRRKSIEVGGLYKDNSAMRPPLVPKDTWLGWISQPWTLTDPALGAAFAIPDDQAHEDGSNVGKTFPHQPASDGLPPARLANGLLMTPAGGDYVTAAAVEALTRYGLGTNGPGDLLTLSYSHYDGIGHQFTPASLESVDSLLKLDQQLGTVMQALDATVGAGKWAMVLTSDHGAPTGVPLYINIDAIPDAVTAALAAAGLPAPADFIGAGMHLSTELTPEQRAQTVDIARRVAKDTVGVEDLIDLTAPEGPFAGAFSRSMWPGRSPDLQLLLVDNGVPLYGDDPTGTTHGSPRPYDQRVPLLAWGAGIAGAAGETVDVRQVAPTVAALLGLPSPNGAELGPVETALK